MGITYSDLTDDQKECIRVITSGYKRGDIIQGITGRAGTGKTSVIKFIVDELDLDPETEVIFCAFTGKAAANLSSKGYRAQTIHSAFYDCVDTPKYKDDGSIMRSNGRIVTTMKFVKKNFISPRIKLIVVDEFSMVSEDLFNAICSFGVQQIVLGDTNQLPPVFGKCMYNKYVKYTLTEIMRQHKDSGIVQLASLILDGEKLPRYHNWNNEAWVLSKGYLTDDVLMRADIILTSKNSTRNIFNEKLRELNHHHGKLPDMGEKLICRKNCWSRELNGMPLINGTAGTVVYPIDRSECELGKGIYRCDFKPDYVTSKWDYYECLPCDYDFLNEPCSKNKEKSPWNPGVALEYGYAITTHLSQGSEYPFVVYYDEWCGDRDYMRQLRYTAITRAKKKIMMFTDG